MSEKKALPLILGPVIGICVSWWLSQTSDLSEAAAITAGVTVLTVIWWILQPVPIAVASLIPIAVLPMLAAAPQQAISQAYGHPLIMLLMGGFILSTAMAKSGAHRRLALFMVNLFGKSSSRSLVLGFMVASAFLSMWISNTATTLMLLPVAMAVLEKSPDKALAIPLLLGIAFASNVGGIGTPIGTPPNAVFMAVYETNTQQRIEFLQWMSWGIPTVILFVPIIWLWLTRHLNYKGAFELPSVGPWRPPERRVMIVFALTALAWMTISEPFGGWRNCFAMGCMSLPTANYGHVALIAVIIMFLVPDGYGKGDRLLDWDTATKIPWGMLLLFAGGLSIASAFGSSGLSDALGQSLSILNELETLVLIAAICLGVTFLTEVTSNTATTTLLMPILASAALAASIDPKLLMLPAAMSASCAFMLPVATAPNTVMFSTGEVPITTMIREGVVLNLLGAMVITTVVYLLI